MKACTYQKTMLFIYWFVVYLVTVSSSGYIAHNDMMINKQGIAKDMEGRGNGLV
jgi:hypothetical protein